MSFYEITMWLMELYICLILTVEYLWGRSDTDIKNEAKTRAKIRREKHSFENLTIGESK